MTYTWEITGVKTIDTVDVTNAVIQTYWKKTGTDENGNKGVFSGATPFPQSSINTGSFIPYTELTEEIVLGWIQGVVVGSYEEHVNDQIQKHYIETQTNIPYYRVPYFLVGSSDQFPEFVKNHLKTK